jgi:hypothetical protein
MLVALSNVVKVESVPLNSDEFSPMVATGGTLIDHTATMRFNPPPSWPPAPPGWTPPPGWLPDPSWPPLPPGWPLWVPDAPRRKTGLIIGALAATLLVGVGVVVAVVATSGRTATGTATRPATTSAIEPQRSDEDQVRDVVDRFEQSWNDNDFDAMSEILCEDMRNDPQFDQEIMSEIRDDSGTLTLTIAELDINGDAATATILNRGTDPDDIDFAREDGEWKWCEF